MKRRRWSVLEQTRRMEVLIVLYYFTHITLTTLIQAVNSRNTNYTLTIHSHTHFRRFSEMIRTHILLTIPNRQLFSSLRQTLQKQHIVQIDLLHSLPSFCPTPITPLGLSVVFLCVALNAFLIACLGTFGIPHALHSIPCIQF